MDGNRFVIDTVAFINYHNSYFSESDKLTGKTRDIISKCLDSSYNYYKLIVPSVVFIEIFKKFLRNEEDSKRFYYEVYSPIRDLDDVEIKSIEKEVLELMIKIGPEHSLDLHDKLIYASAAQLQCPLISNDPKIIKANKTEHLVPDILF